MARIPDLSGAPSSNPLVMLRDALVAVHQTTLVMAQSLQQIAANTAKPVDHHYALAITAPGTWMVYCHACSEAEHAYVFPCVNHADVPEENLPPRMFDMNP